MFNIDDSTPPNILDSADFLQLRSRPVARNAADNTHLRRRRRQVAHSFTDSHPAMVDNILLAASQQSLSASDEEVDLSGHKPGTPCLLAQPSQPIRSIGRSLPTCPVKDTPYVKPYSFTTDLNARVDTEHDFDGMRTTNEFGGPSSYPFDSMPLNPPLQDPFKVPCTNQFMSSSEYDRYARLLACEQKVSDIEQQFADMACKTDKAMKQFSGDKASAAVPLTQAPLVADLPPPSTIKRTLPRIPSHPSEQENRSAFLVPADIFSRTMADSEHRAISDTVLAPKPFCGSSDQDAEQWLEYFNRYCRFRHLSARASEELFKMLLRDSAADFIACLPGVDTMSLADLQDHFRQNYFRNPELRWKEASDLWCQGQQPKERVQDYVIRLRRAAKRLNLGPDVQNYALVNGLKPQIRMAVVQNGLKTLEETIKAARIAEAAAETSEDPAQSVLLQALRDHIATSSRQSDDIKQLTSCVATLLSGTQQQSSIAASTMPPVVPSQQPATGRILKPTPQNRQRQSYGQQSLNHQGGQRFARPVGDAQQYPCGWCGKSHHLRSACPAQGQQCNKCGKMNHYSKVCRSGRPNRA